MKKKELLKRIEALEAIVKPIADLQKASEKTKVVEEKQYTPKIGDVVKAWGYKEKFFIGEIEQIEYKDKEHPYFVNYIWCSKVEPITDENIIKLFK